MSIDVERLSKCYKRGFSVSDVSFRVAAGEVVGLLGPNGAGKSVIVRILLGAERPTSGTATFGGQRFRELRDPLRTVGSLRPLPRITWGRTAEDYLGRLQARHGIAPDRVAAVLDQVCLTANARNAIDALSSGMRQRLALAGALLGEPRYLVLDEPFAGLDPDAVTWWGSTLRQLAARGVGVLAASHQWTELATSADRLLLIAQGRMRAEIPTGGDSRESVESMVRAGLAGRSAAHEVSQKTFGDWDGPGPAHRP